MRLGLRLVLCLWLVGSLVGAGGAADVTWRVSAGFGGAVKERAWTPIFVEISNEGESQTGRVVIPVTFGGRTDYVVNYAAEVELPRHAKKRYTVYVPNTRYDRVLLDLSRTRERRDPPNMQVAGPEDLLVVVVGGDEGYLSFLNGAKGFGVAPPGFDPRQGGGRSQAREVSASVGHLRWEDLPESWIGWDGVEAVVLGDAAFSGASQQGLEALRHWVQMGGMLVVPGGAGSTGMASGPFAEFLPITISGTESRSDLAAVGEWCDQPIAQQPVLAARGNPLPGARVLCGTQEEPLIASRRAGSGRVVFTAFDFAAAPVKYWEGQNALWRKLLSDRPSRRLLAQVAERELDYYSYLGGVGPNAGLAQVASTMPEAELPSLWLIIGFLVAYILVLVPVNYSFLHRLDRRELAWVTTPAIVVVFTLGAYAIGYGMRGGTIVLNRIGVIEARAGATAAHGMGYLGLFSPARTNYEIALGATAEGARDLAIGDQHVRGRTTIFSMPKPRIAEVEMNMWTTRPFGVEFMADLGKGITGDLEYDGTSFVGRVRNGSTLALDDCHVVRGMARGKGQKLGPGEEAEVAFVPSQTSPVPQQPQYYHGQRQSVPLDKSAVGALLSVQSARGYSGSNAPILVATTKSMVVPATLRGTKPSVEDATLVVVHVPIRLARHQVMQIPSWLVESRVIATTGTVSSEDPYSGNPEQMEIEQGSMVTEYAVPAEGGAVEARSVELSTSSGGGVDPAVEVAAYDFRRGRWETVRARTVIPPVIPSGAGGMGGRGRGAGRAPSGQGGGVPGPSTVTLPHPQDFMSPEGRVQVKVSVPSGTASVSPFVLNATVRTQ